MSRVSDCMHAEYWGHVENLTDDEKDYLESKGVAFEEGNSSPVFECESAYENWAHEVEELLEEFNE